MAAELSVRIYVQGDEQGVVRLWQECGLVVPWNDPQKDIERKMQVGSELFLVGQVGDDIVATVMGGYEGHRGWINYLAVAPQLRGKGYGRKMMAEVEERIGAMGCSKINLQVRTSNKDVLLFYVAIGYKIDDVVSLGKRLTHD